MKFKQFLNEKLDDTVSKALKVKIPNEINKYSDDTINNNISLLTYAVSLQKKEVIKSDEEKSQVAILDDLEDKLRRWEEYEPKDTKEPKSSEKEEIDPEEEKLKDKEEDLKDKESDFQDKKEEENEKLDNKKEDLKDKEEKIKEK